MDIRKYIFSVLACVACLPSLAETFATESGMLENNLSGRNLGSISELVLTGTMDARDFKFVAEQMTGLTSLDVSGVSVTEYSGRESLIGNYVAFPANELPSGCFMGKGYRKIVLPSSLASIGDGALAGCAQLESVNIPASVKKIGDFAFSGSAALRRIEGAAGVAEIGDYAFSNCPALASVGFPKVEKIGNYAFLGDSGLNALQFPATTTEIGEGAFKHTALGRADLSGCKKLTKIGSWAFADNAALQEVVFHDGISSIGEGAFFSTSLGSAELPGGISKLDDLAFASNRSLESVSLPDGVKEIGGYALADCSAISSLTIPAGVDAIGDEAFRNCNGLSEIKAEPTTPPALGEDVWKNLDKSGIELEVPTGSENLYKSADQWRDFFSGMSEVNLNEVYLHAAFDGAVLHVKSADVIADAAVYDLKGLLIAEKHPDATEVGFNLAGSQEQMLILRCRFGDGIVRLIKIVRNK